MKKFRYFLSLIPILIVAIVSNAAELQNYAFPFIGKWNNTEEPMLIDDYGFQDIQNVRKDGKRFKTVDGHTKINGYALTGNTFNNVLNGFHFRKSTGTYTYGVTESHVLVSAGNNASNTATAGAIYKNDTAIPGTGNFTLAAVYTSTLSSDPYRFSSAPQDHVVATNWGDPSLIWGGDEQPVTAFITSSADITYEVTNPYDYSETLRNWLYYYSGSTATLIGASSELDSYYKFADYYNNYDGANTSTAYTGQVATFYGNAQTDTARKEFGATSLLLDGTGDYITYPDSEDWNFGTGDFTIDFWYYSGGLGDDCIVSQFASASNEWGVFTMGGYLTITGLSAGGNFTYVTTAQSIAANVWNYVEVNRSGDTLRAFVGGSAKELELSGGAFTAATAMPNLANVLTVGRWGTDATYDTNGWIDSLRISKGKARHTSDYSVPTTELDSIGSSYFIVGAKRPLQGVLFYVSSGNSSASTLTGYQWTGSAWAALSLTDGTSSGGKTLSQTGWVTFQSTVNTSRPRYIDGYALYWYKFYFNVGSASLYHVSVDAPIQPIKNIWDGTEVQAVKVKKYDNATYTDYSNHWFILNRTCKKTPNDPRCIDEDYIDLVGDNDDSTFANFGALDNTYRILLGFTQPMQGFDLRFVPSMVNANASTLSVQYWTGQGWSSVLGLSDGTTASSKSFNKNGVIAFSPILNESKLQIGDTVSLYYYKLAFSNTLSANVQISEIRGIPVPEPLSYYRFSQTFQNRLFLFNDRWNSRNKAIYSAYDTSDVFNGRDSGELTFGDGTDLVAAAPIYNVFNTQGGVEQLIVTKNNETYRVTGSGPSTWQVQRLSSNIGCVAPLSMVSADTTSVDNVRKQVAIWMSDKGVYMTDGSTVQDISGDIAAYFNPTSSVYIPAGMQKYSYGWYDPNLKSYKLLVASNTTCCLTAELEYSLKYNEWTKVYRENAAGANPLQCGFQVTDTNGKSYTYGGDRSGYMYRLENGNNWDGVANITSYLWTKDIILDQAQPLFRLSTIKNIRTVHKKKATGTIAVTHYGDGTATTSGTNGQMGPANISATNAANAIYDTQSVLLGPNLTHSFKFSATSNITSGMELTGFGLWLEPYTAIRQ